MADELITFEENGYIKASEVNRNFDALQEQFAERLSAFEEQLNEMLDEYKGNFVLPGTIVGIPSASIPIGYLLCDGASLLRTEYGALFDAIGDTYGAEDDEHFNLPDFRGMFLRGAGGENSASIGLVQECAVPNIRGGISFSGTDPSTNKGSATGAFTKTNSSGAGNGHDTGQSSAKFNFNFDASAVSNVYKDDVTEVRPINQSVNWVIKY